MKRTLSTAALGAALAGCILAGAGMAAAQTGAYTPSTRAQPMTGVQSQYPPSDDPAAMPSPYAAPGSGSTGNAAGMPTGASTAPGTGGPAAGSEPGRVLARIDPVTDQRRGPGQRPIELMQTSLLNSFSAYGFDAVRGFRKDGQRYLADVSRGGQWMTVELNPDTGTITTVR